MKPLLSVVIPYLSSPREIPLIVIDIDKQMENSEYSWELVLVDGGVDDKISEIVKGMSRAVKNLKLVNSSGSGLDKKIRSGMLLANGKIRLLFDPKSGVSIDQINRVISVMDNEDARIVFARRVWGSNIVRALVKNPKIIFTLVANFVFILIFLRSIHDVFCKFIVFTEGSAESIIGSMRRLDLTLGPRVIFSARKLGYKAREVIVEV